MRPHHRAFVRDPTELRMGSPQYGRLILDGEELATHAPGGIECDSLVWSDDGRFLAAQEVDHSIEYPGTRVIVVDADRRAVIAASPGRSGLSKPVRFDGGDLLYTHWHYRHGEQELRLDLSISQPSLRQ
jgi:hypothetical protein